MPPFQEAAWRFAIERYARGVAAGFIATLVLSLLLVVMMDVMPQLAVVSMLSDMLRAPGAPLAGWIAHFMIGTVAWGLSFASFAYRLRGPYWFRGALAATGAWLLMMIIVMPMAGAGMFGISEGLMAPLITLLLHWIFGTVLGKTYIALACAYSHRYAA